MSPYLIILDFCKKSLVLRQKTKHVYFESFLVCVSHRVSWQKLYDIYLDFSKQAWPKGDSSWINKLLKINQIHCFQEVRIFVKTWEKQMNGNKLQCVESVEEISLIFDCINKCTSVKWNLGSFAVVQIIASTDDRLVHFSSALTLPFLCSFKE